MRIEKRTNIDVKVHGRADLYLTNPDITIEEAIKRLKDKGNQILEIDETTKRITVLDTSMYLEEDVWVCEYCGAYSKNKSKVEKHEMECLENPAARINIMHGSQDC